MLRLVLPALLALAGCATQAPAVIASAPRTSDPALMQAFFGSGEQLGVSSALRCATRCTNVR